MKPHPPECRGTVEHHEGTQLAMPWGDDRETVTEWCPECGWVGKRTRAVSS